MLYFSSQFNLVLFKVFRLSYVISLLNLVRLMQRNKCHLLILRLIVRKIRYMFYRWLKPGGIILPCTASLYMAPICDDEVVIEKVNFWNDMLDVYGIDMSCVLPFARQSLSKDVSLFFKP